MFSELHELPFNPATSAIRFVSSIQLKAHSKCWYLRKILREIAKLFLEKIIYIYTPTHSKWGFLALLALSLIFDNLTALLLKVEGTEL